MTTFHCGSCSYQGSDLDELRRHGRESGHAVRESEIEAAGDGPTSVPGAFDARSLAAAVGTSIGLLGLGAALYYNRQYKGASAALAGATATAAGLVVELAEKVTEIDFLKSASGAASVLAKHKWTQQP
ncbi:hypothetical protein [Kitasatospora sp. NPDC059673]|uniref:hypothetical protein n=1 Tax=Kitasatospora sp. NPDC059673 TaxID=3346901 RepID=UPI0036C44DB5